MMNKYVKIMCVLDRSGSMDSIIGDAIGGFNSFLKEQKEVDGDATMDIMLFDTEFISVANNLDINSVEPFTKKTYVPRGGTSLYDAIGKTIDDEIDRIATLSIEKRPEKTLCVILTDGDENCSNEYSQSLIKQIIGEMREDFKWEFIFLGANQDACFTADSIGISKGNAMSFAATGEGVSSAYVNISNATTNYRTTTGDHTNMFDDTDK